MKNTTSETSKRSTYLSGQTAQQVQADRVQTHEGQEELPTELDVDLPDAVQHRGRGLRATGLAALAIAAAAITTAVLILGASGTESPVVPASDASTGGDWKDALIEQTGTQPTGDWKDALMGQAGTEFSGDWKDALVGQTGTQPTGDWKDALIEQGR